MTATTCNTIVLLALLSLILVKCGGMVEDGWQHEGTKTYHPGKPGPRGTVPK